MNIIEYIKAYFAVKQVAEDFREAFPPTDLGVKMNIFVKDLIVFGLNQFVNHEPQMAAHLTNAVEKKLLDDAVVAVKALLPVIQAL